MNQLISLGITENLSNIERKKIRILNLFVIIGAFLGLIYIVIDLIVLPFDLLKMASLVIGVFCVLLCAILQHFHQYRIARFLMILLISIIFIKNANVSFKGFYGEYYYLLIPIMTLMFFEKRWVHVSSLVLSIVLFYVPNYFLDIYPEQYFGYSNVLFLFGGVFLVLSFFKTENQKNESAILKFKNKEIQNIQQQLFRIQMNPHFLFNSLTAIQHYMVANNPLEAGVYTAKFARLMRQVLEFSREDYILLEDEINALKNYIELQQIRFKNKFEYSVEIDESIAVDAIRIPPMFAQPVIENAIEHGIAKSENTCNLRISYFLSDGLLSLQVVDDGVGLGTLKADSSHKSMAQEIIRERLAVINDNRLVERASFQLEALDRGTKALFNLPYQVVA
ncbi:MAG: histidine kinase [Bacteroidota bacterium]